ncbi:MAG: hypothetical protein IT384_14720 [Deltaproteobacteria bacterium]|nr:hypothetical protein [Deltaproteobacteria bacterium]
MSRGRHHSTASERAETPSKPPLRRDTTVPGRPRGEPSWKKHVSGPFDTDPNAPLDELTSGELRDVFAILQD